MSRSMIMSWEPEVKVLTRDGERENKFPEAELGESEELWENSVSIPEVAVILCGDNITEETDCAWCLSKLAAVLARDRDGDWVVVDSKGWAGDWDRKLYRVGSKFWNSFERRWYLFRDGLKRETEEDDSEGGSSKLSNEEEWVEGGRRRYISERVQESSLEERSQEVLK